MTATATATAANIRRRRQAGYLNGNDQTATAGRRVLGTATEFADGGDAVYAG